ncbi:MAG: hypothetical protein JHC26_00835 [Thermofilum sp.]|jgi:hypothetical protein|uniref:hypothetical protein n=1 Tax=Thermofilum sp. TaxID=1961369 RepID=UPI00258BF698|nr:hypothetical protein [Thermofilum sp.]MCI4407610.1 hypothetical protein [Thermofilum sp.]
MEALRQIVNELTNRKDPLTILNNEEILVFSLAETYVSLIKNTYNVETNPIEVFIKTLKLNKIHGYGRARADLVSVAQSIKVNVATKGSGSLPILSDKEVVESK